MTKLIRSLFGLAAIEPKIPNNFNELSDLASKFGKNVDGPACLNSVRNCYVHSIFETREDIYENDAGMRLYQLKQLSMHYLDLILLWKFDYHGIYRSRVKEARFVTGAYERVPWANQNIS